MPTASGGTHCSKASRGDVKLAILTPSFGYGRFIGDCIESIISQQTAWTVTHVIQDAGSTDETRTVVSCFQQRGRVEFHTERDNGQSDAMNRALRNADSVDYVGWLNADEFYLEGALETVYHAAQTFPDAAVIFGDCIFVDESGALLRAVPAHRMSPRVLRDYGSFLSSCAVFVRRDVLGDAPWDTRLREAMDWDLWLTLLARGRFVYVPKALGAFRVHPSQVTQLGTSGDQSEARRIRAKHAIQDSRMRATLARWEHRLLKIIDGGYVAEHRARAQRGKRLQWWNPETRGSQEE